MPKERWKHLREQRLNTPELCAQYERAKRKAEELPIEDLDEDVLDRIWEELSADTSSS